MLTSESFPHPLLLRSTTDKKYGPIARPIFVSCDPARDSVPAVKKYVGGALLFSPEPSPLTQPCTSD